MNGAIEKNYSRYFDLIVRDARQLNVSRVCLFLQRVRSRIRIPLG